MIPNTPLYANKTAIRCTQRLKDCNYKTMVCHNAYPAGCLQKKKFIDPCS